MPDKIVLPRFFVYAAVGATGTAAHYAVLVSAVSMARLDPVAASMCGALVGAWINFLLNARLTFRSKASLPAAVRFAATALMAAAANGLAMAVLTGWLLIPWLAAQLVVTAGLLTLTFLVNSLWTFRSDPR
jgi:putative flippase GtrA